MKTPREILLARHRGVEPKLDELRQKVLANLSSPRCADAPVRVEEKEATARMRAFVAQSQGSEPWVVRTARNLWRELICPCRRAWAGLVVVWLLLLAANVEMKAGAVAGRSSVPTREIALALAEEQRVLAELLQPNPPPPAAEPPRANPRPRSERASAMKMA
jgi:hypothetical protein